MTKRTIIPFGPQHPVLPEPIHLDLVLEDELVIEAIPSIGFIHRGLEKLVEKKDFIDFLLKTGALRVSGDYTLKSKRSSPWFVNIGDFNDGESSDTLTGFSFISLIFSIVDLSSSPFLS